MHRRSPVTPVTPIKPGRHRAARNVDADSLCDWPVTGWHKKGGDLHAATIALCQQILGDDADRLPEILGDDVAVQR